MKYRNILAISIVTALAVIPILAGGGMIQKHSASAFTHGKETASNMPIHYVVNKGIDAGITSGVGISDNISVQENGDTTAKDSSTPQAAGLNNQETLQGSDNFNNQQDHSKFLCISCIF
jgi:hypothetical protein